LRPRRKEKGRGHLRAKTEAMLTPRREGNNPTAIWNNDEKVKYVELIKTCGRNFHSI